jgi:hypothetical protein
MSEVREARPPVDCMYLLRATSPPHPSFLTETTQGRRMGYGYGPSGSISATQARLD